MSPVKYLRLNVIDVQKLLRQPFFIKTVVSIVKKKMSKRSRKVAFAENVNIADKRRREETEEEREEKSKCALIRALFFFCTVL